MVRNWLAARRSFVVTTTSLSLIAALVATVAIVSQGYTAQHLNLGDGSVWVANNQQQAIGRANPDVLELNTVVASTGSDIDVIQRGTTVLLFNRTENKVDIVDPATSTITQSVPLPPNQPELFLAGDNVVVLERGTGELWIRPLADLARFNSGSASSLSLGAGAIVSVDPAGLLFAFSPATSLVYRVNAAISDVAESPRPLGIRNNSPTLSITSVAGQWAVLDSAANQLYLDGRVVDLSGIVGSGTGAVLQWASSAGDRVLVNYSGGLISVPLSGAAAVGLVGGKSGIPARPLALGGCEFAAWTNGDNWRRCASDPGAGTTLALAKVVGNASLTFAANGDRAVLNDRRSGATWAVQRSGELINNWRDLVAADSSKPQQQQNDPNIPPQVEKVQLPPVAIDDAFGARPGRATVLPVLLNDFDPNGDVLVISDLVPIDPTVGRIELISQRQQIQLTLLPGASGQVTFRYSITDGRGGTATATVVVTIRTAGENSPPKQVRVSKTTVQAGGRITTQVLSDWVDPDGDAIYLTRAAVASPDIVSYKPGGAVVYSDSGSGGDSKIVTLVVSDGKAESSGSLSISVKPVGQVPIVADPFMVLAYAGQEITVTPLDHVRGGNGTLRLNSVPAKPDVTITPSYETGTFRFTSTAVRSHYLEYVVTDGTQTLTALVRVDVAAPPDANSKPITVPKTIFVTTLRTERIDVARTDVDPAGGVLLVTGILNLKPNSGVRAEVLDQAIVRVSLDAPLDKGPVTFNYRVTNGLAEALGVITVVEIPTPARVQPPIANDDTVTVRVGQAIDIPVLANDEHPDGLELTLQPKLAQDLPANSGLLFASGRVLRYLAPEKAGNFTAAYTVTGPDGQAATALVHIAVREADVATNNAPVPTTVTARVFAGGTVRVKIPLTGIDPDGDSVQLLGQATNPQKGAVIDVASDTISYQAGAYSAGTDTFSYSVIDALGARATGTVRIGISPRLDGARNPVAQLDAVTVRPGVTVSVQVLANDTDPDGGQLTVVSATPNDPVTTAKVVGDVVQVTPPRTAGNYGVIYTIENPTGGSSQNFIRVTVDPNAPLARPRAADSVLTLSDVLGRDRVSIDVLANVFFADGDARALDLSVYPGYGATARVTSAKRIEVTIANKSQIIPFKVTHPDDPSVFSYAFIRVPGFDDALPQVDRRAQSLQVKSEEKLVIDLNKYVIAVGGKRVRLTDTSTVRATHADGSDLVIDGGTLVFTSADKYFGPASISFEVTDGTSATDPNGRKAVIVLPISVSPRDNQPPAFGGAVIAFEPGQEKVIDLLKLTNYPYPKDLGELAYSVLSPLPVGFTYTLSGSSLTLRADDNALKGSTTALSLGVRDALNDGRAGRIELSVVQSTRPLVMPAADTAVVKRGDTVSLDVLANDEATNPFPGKPLKVVGIRGLGGSGLPVGVQIQPSADSSKLSVTVAATAQPVDVSLQYQVADATGDPDRNVWGSITISVQDRPDPVSTISATGFGDRTIDLRWNAGAFNNSPITGYRVITRSPSGTALGSTNCAGTTCTIPTPGNGSAHAMIVSIVATNAIGDSDPASLSTAVWSDVIPAAPTGLAADPLDHGLRVTWDRVPDPAGGSPVSGYLVAVGGIGAIATCGSARCGADIVDGSLANGSLVTYSVSARNDAYGPLATWNSASQQAMPAGPPLAIAAPLATSISDTVVQLDWAGVFTDNGRPITGYRAVVYSATAPSCAAPDPPGSQTVSTTATTTQFSGLSANGAYSLMVLATNSQGCSASPAVVAHTAPAVITALATSGPNPNGANFDFTITGGSMGAEPLTSDYTIYYVLDGGRVTGGERGPIGLGAFLSTDDGSQYGSTITVRARACRSYGAAPVCQSQLSPPFHLGVPVNPQIRGLTFTPNPLPGIGGTFNWLGWPVGDYQDVQYACGAAPGGSFSDADTSKPGRCDATGVTTAYLTIRVVANGGKTYDITYASN